MQPITTVLYSWCQWFCHTLILGCFYLFGCYLNCMLNGAFNKSESTESILPFVYLLLVILLPLHIRTLCSVAMVKQRSPSNASNNPRSGEANKLARQKCSESDICFQSNGSTAERRGAAGFVRVDRPNPAVPTQKKRHKRLQRRR